MVQAQMSLPSNQQKLKLNPVITIKSQIIKEAAPNYCGSLSLFTPSLFTLFLITPFYSPTYCSPFNSALIIQPPLYPFPITLYHPSFPIHYLPPIIFYPLFPSIYFPPSIFHPLFSYFPLPILLPLRLFNCTPCSTFNLCMTS